MSLTTMKFLLWMFIFHVLLEKPLNNKVVNKEVVIQDPFIKFHYTDDSGTSNIRETSSVHTWKIALVTIINTQVALFFHIRHSWNQCLFHLTLSKRGTESSIFINKWWHILESHTYKILMWWVFQTCCQKPPGYTLWSV